MIIIQQDSLPVFYDLPAGAVTSVISSQLKYDVLRQVKLEEQTKKAEEMEDKVHTAETNVKRLEMEVDSAVREKVSLKDLSALSLEMEQVVLVVL